ncbi:motility associated factor glycosyltransferase family protein [Paenibacillus validus]|uniref:motility associated factor glycosyltransferase family protein n=1 Tax=Paenibacillus validus TaxID=44253 RepID=UPI003D2A4088
MILTKNMKWLEENFYGAIAKLQEPSENEGSFHLESAKNGINTVVYGANGRSIYLHSKYNPLNESEQFIKQFEQLDEFEHVFFYGVGLGYHVDLLLKKFPHLTFTLYEPEFEVFRLYLSQKSLADLPIKRLRKVYIARDEQDQSIFIRDFVSSVSGKTLLVTLPSYEQLNPVRYMSFVNQFREALNLQMFSFSADFRFEKRWTVNCLKNLPYTIKTPNIIQDFKDKFKDKPAIVVAAGPSLEEDIPTIRYIRENGLAYIFSVGSAIKALIGHGIYPDAACTYDPMPWNLNVFEDVRKHQITSIPLFYGSSVGYETLEHYPGPLAHMITSQDTLATVFLNRNDGRPLEQVSDAPTIAVVALELLHKLGCNPIILAGQNLAYKGDQFYSKGIGYEYRPSSLTEEELANAKLIKDVHGNDIYTSPGFDRMRTHMESVIRLHGMTNIYNTTKGGAHIEGTTFITIDELVKERLQHKQVVTDWYQNKQSYSLQLVVERVQYMVQQHERVGKILESLVAVTKTLKSTYILSSPNKLDRKLENFELLIKDLENNAFYNTIVKPMNRLQNDLLIRALEAKAVRLEKSKVIKAKAIAELFKPYLDGCLEDVREVTPMFNEVTENLLNQYGAAV